MALYLSRLSSLSLRISVSFRRHLSSRRLRCGLTPGGIRGGLCVNNGLVIGSELVCDEGIEVIELHHTRKTGNGAKRENVTVDDIYGSTWLTSGAGSVLFLNGQPGDPIIEMHHVKQPMDEIGPYKLIHDHTRGTTSIWHETDLLEVARIRGTLTAKDAAAVINSTDDPTANEIQKARTKLVKLTREGLLRVSQAGSKGGSATVWAYVHEAPKVNHDPNHDPSQPEPITDESRPSTLGGETPSQSNHAPNHSNHAAGKSRAGGSLKNPACVPTTPEPTNCTVCRGPMTNLGDGQTTHPGCQED